MRKLILGVLFLMNVVSISAMADYQIASYEKYIWFNFYNSSTYGYQVHNFIVQSAEDCYNRGGSYFDHDQHYIYGSYGAILYRHEVKCMVQAQVVNKASYYSGGDEASSEESYGEYQSY